MCGLVNVREALLGLNWKRKIKEDGLDIARPMTETRLWTEAEISSSFAVISVGVFVYCGVKVDFSIY